MLNRNPHPSPGACPAPGRWAQAARLAAKVFLINSAVALLVLPLVDNTYRDLWVSAQVVGFTLLAFLRPALGWSPPGRPRVLLIVGALLAGALVGTVLVVLVKGRDLTLLLEDRHHLAAFATTACLGVVFGAVASLVMAGRARIAVFEAELMRSEAERQKLARQTSEAELQVLRAQIEPHFLFNTLANLRYLIAKDPRTAEDMLDNLIEYLQSATPRMRSRTSTLGQELSMCNAYLKIYKIRMGERLDFSIAAPSPLHETPFPPMMLITLVENAIKHGLDPLPAGGRLEIAAAREADRLVVTVADTGKAPSEEAQAGQAHGVGLKNISERLAIIYAGQARFSLAPNPSGGSIARIEIPAVE